jgi:hypothetical protein
MASARKSFGIKRVRVMRNKPPAGLGLPVTPPATPTAPASLSESIKCPLCEISQARFSNPARLGSTPLRAPALAFCLDTARNSVHNAAMPSINLTDQLRLVFSIDPGALKSLGKYLQSPATLNLKNLTDRIDALPFQSLDAGLEFDSPVNLGTDAVELTVGAGLSGGFSIFVPQDENNQLFGEEHYGEPLTVPLDQAYVSVSMTASVSAGLAGNVFNLSFGFSPGSTTTLTSYKRFSTQPSLPGVVDALKSTIEDFAIPGDIHDLEIMPDGAISTVDGNGTLKFSAKANLLAAANPIASVEVPVAGQLAVTAGATVTVGSSFELSCDYQVRVRKLARDRVRLGYYKKRGSEFSVRAGSAAGLSLPVGETDVLSAILGAVSPDPVNADELKKAGLDDGRIAAIQEAIKAGVERKLELAAALEFGALSSKEAAFLFDIDLASLDADGRQALHQALDGDLSLLAVDEDALPAGVTLRRSILSELKGKQHVFKVNLFGIYNLLSVTEVLREGSVTYDPVNGLTILDKATATRIQAAIGSLDTEKLRKLLADFFLITAAYRGSKLAVGAPELKSTHSYFELHGKTNFQTMKDNLEVAEAMHLLDADTKRSFLDGISDFGRTTLLAEAEYDSALCRRMFLDDNGRPRSEEEYDRIGLQALRLLVQPDDPDPYRRRPAEDPALWSRMKELGQPSFRQVFPGLNEVQLAVVQGDYTLIRWWSSAMRATAEVLAAIEEVPVHDPEDNRFKIMRVKFSRHLATVAERTQPRWSDPWGLIAVDLLTGRAGDASVEITGPKLALSKARRFQIAAASEMSSSRG